MAEYATTDASETLIEAEPSTQDMDLETPIATTEEQLPAADSKRSREDSGEDSRGAQKLKVEKSAVEDRLDQLEGTEGDKKLVGSALDPRISDPLWRCSISSTSSFIMGHPMSMSTSKHSIEIQAETLASFAHSVGQSSVATTSFARCIIYYVV